MQSTPESRPLAIIVDDEAGIRRFVRLAAEEAGFDVTEAENGDDLLKTLSHCAPALIVLDLQMSSTDGVETLRELAERKVTAKIILFSGMDIRTLESARDIAQRRGIDISAILQKPVRRDALIQKFKQINLESQSFTPATLRKCLDQQLIAVHYQPKLSLETLEIVGMEALLRCRDEIGRVIPPEKVVETAEAASMIDDLTERVFRLALQQRQMWSQSGVDLDMAINVSPRCSFDRRFPELLADLCTEANVPTNSVTIELTETAVMDDDILGTEALLRLRLKGFRLSIDDFGTGYSSLLRLKQLPFSEIKVDKSFVMDLAGSRDNEVIVKTIIQLAQGMDLHCVVEGVETEAALRYAARLGCNDAQGYFIARPMPGPDMLGFLKAWVWRKAPLHAVLPSPDDRDDGSQPDIIAGE
jgi:EAL domain-containing protein (putative c-di-GMP-specific phosphodiesterase class I)/ActR/RegA family two-component response regulator